MPEKCASTRLPSNQILLTPSYTHSNDCNANVNGNRGCSYAEVVEADRSYGKPFNDAGGGVFATVFADDGISQYLWSRTNVPSNIEAPDVATWGQPTARFPSSTCKTDEFFADQTLVRFCRGLRRLSLELTLASFGAQIFGTGSVHRALEATTAEHVRLVCRHYTVRRLGR